METIEDIILRHSKRGMNILREYLKEDYSKEAAEYILSWPQKNIFLTTGFYVAGYAETDGPVGTLMLAEALKKLSYNPVIITDEYCRGFFENRDIDIVYMPIDAGIEFCEKIISEYNPAGLISIERCGRNINDDYANMRGVSIKENTARTDLFFELTKGKIPSVGVGDGGNEIGMGNLSEVISKKLSLVPCDVGTDYLVIATVSNWGAYGICAYLEQITGQKLLWNFEEVRKYIEDTVNIGSVDGVLKERTVSVDGFDISIEKEIVDALTAFVRK